MSSVEIIARQLCAIAGVDPDGMAKAHTPNWQEMRAQASQIEAALLNEGYSIKEGAL